MRRLALVGLLQALSVVFLKTGASALSPREVLVVYNRASSVRNASQGVAEYYRSLRDIPPENVVGILTDATESVLEQNYLTFVAGPLWTNYLSKPEYSHIRVIVLCYGIPSWIHIWVSNPEDNDRRSVDSCLSLLGNDGVLEPENLRLVRTNPYYLACQEAKQSFEDFRETPANRIDRSDGETWRMRYLVCRLDGYSVPTEEVTLGGNTYRIPSDVKALIDRAMIANRGGKGDLTQAQVVLDDCPGRIFPNTTEQQINALLQPITSDPDNNNVLREPGAETGTNSYAKEKDHVIAYSSSGSYDRAANSVTTCWRPFLSWEEGGLGIYNAVSGDGYWLRTPNFSKHWASYRETDPGLVQPHTLTVRNADGLYPGCWLHLCDSSVSLRSAQFSAELMGGSLFQVARIDLTGVSLADGGIRATIECRFPSDDPYHGGELLAEPARIGTELYSCLESGYTFRQGEGQSLGVELIRDGASAVTANVGEPGGGGFSNPNIIIPSYLAGYTWAESAWMGIPSLQWQQIAIGDPLMAPFLGHPAANFVDPTPAQDSSVAGLVPLNVAVAADGSGDLHVDFRAVDDSGSSRPIATCDSSPWLSRWDTSKWPDGGYTVVADVRQTGEGNGLTTISRHCVVANAGNSLPAITEPAATSIANAAVPVTVTVSGNASKVQMWVFSGSSAVLEAEDNTAPYECILALRDGLHEIQAVATDEATGTLSYSSAVRVIVANGVPVFSSVASGGAKSNGTEIVLGFVPVVAGTTAGMDGAFYIEDSERIAGTRVETSQEVPEGRLVAVRGVLHKADTIERHISATSIWDIGQSATPAPLSISLRDLGGFPGDGSPGVIGGRGTHNTGLLVRTCGKVTYSDDSFIYIDDGSAMHDGNTLVGAYCIPPAGGLIPDPVPYPPVTGVRVACASLQRKPGIGDIVIVTGISSTAQPAGTIAPYLRPRSQSDVVFAPRDPAGTCSYLDCLKSPSGPLRDLNDNDWETNPIENGARVRMVNAYVCGWQDGCATLMCNAPPYAYVAVWEQIPLPLDTWVTVTGTATSGLDQGIVADAVYLVGTAYGAGSIMPGQPLIHDDTSDAVLLDPLQALDLQPCYVSWILPQPESTVLSSRVQKLIGGGATVCSGTGANWTRTRRGWYSNFLRQLRSSCGAR